MRIVLTVVLTLGMVGCISVRVQHGDHATHLKPTSVADASFFEDYARTRRFSLGSPKSVKLTPDGKAALFLRSGPRSFVQNLFEFDTGTGRERRLLTVDDLLGGTPEMLSDEEKARRERMRMSARGVASYQLSQDGTKILAPLSGRLFVVDRGSGAVTELKSDAGYPIDPQFSRDGNQVTCVRDGDVYVIDLASGVEHRLTTGATEHLTHGLSEFVAQEEMGRFHGTWWSPDGTRLAYQQTDTSLLETMHIMDATHPERAPGTWPYPRPGKPNAVVKLALIGAAGGESTWVQWDLERYPYLATVKWKENAPLTILVQNREQTEQVLLSVDVQTGYTKTLLVERDAAWLNLDQSMPHWLPDGQSFFWTTERNGSWQLEQRDRNGSLLTTVTESEFGYRGFVSYDAETRAVYLTGSDDPIHKYLYSVTLDSSSRTPVRLTPERGQHAVTFSKDHSVYFHTFHSPDGDEQRVMRRANGSEIGRLKSVAEQPPFVPNVELTTVGDDPSFHAALIRPRNFDASVRYPVIVYVYGGPHAQTVSASPRRYLLQQWMADHGYVVVTLDGRGTPSRGRAWERVTKHNLIDIPLDDQVAGLQALGARYAELDLARVGIYGWSFGGYFSAMGVMRRGDVYHAGVAGAPVADWADYDTHYTERYMGLPGRNADGYEKSSVLTYAKDLTRPLLIVHGSADDNVYFMHSLKMSNALFRAGKDHELLVLSDFTHMVADPLVTMRLYSKIMSFFERSLTVKH